MAGRTRTTKKLAQRIDLNYFKRAYAIPRWRRILSIGVTGVGLLWLIAAGLGGKQSPYNAGPLAHPHALLTRNCAACHRTDGTAFARKVSDTACLACHDGPIHQAEQTFTPACMDCHVEHQGAFRLSEIREEACTQCHSNLKTKTGLMTVAAKVTSFAGGHPEFAAVQRPDPGTVKLNHQIHLGTNIRGPNGPVQLKCADCHQRDGARMIPVNYEKHCASCHPLQFDQRFTEPAPHKKPEVVIDFVTAKFTSFIAAHPDEVHKADPADPRIMRPPQPPARDAAEWIARRISDSKQLLWRKSCIECHTLSFRNGAAALPEVPAAAIPARWFQKAEFDHEAHQMLICSECHSKAKTSHETADVLIPGIETCRECHRPGADSAESRCFECHVYHDWSKQKPVTGAFTISATHR
jgi:hypothetical protein